MAAFFDPAANRQAIASEWKRLGWSDLAIAGMLGRAQRESSFNMGITNKNDAGPGLHSKGLFQWNRDRLANLFRFAKQEGGKWTDPKIQARYTHWEITQGPEKKTWERLQKASSLTDAVNAAMLYTRPKGTIRDGVLTPTRGLHYKETLSAARKLYGKVEPAKDPLDQMQSMWDPEATSKNQSDWQQDAPKQNDAKIDFAAQAMTEDRIASSQQELAAANKDLVTPNEGSFNPDLAGALSGLLPGLTNTQSNPTPPPPSINDLQQLFKPRLQWASL